MVAEESGTNFSADGNAIEPQNVPPAPTDGDSRAQIALAFDSAGNAELVAESPAAHDGRKVKRKQPRFDTRRTAEYLAERGRLPAEALHLITRRTLGEAVAYIRKAVPGCSHQWAAEYYMRAIDLLLPYCHLKQSDLDGAGGPDGIHALVAGHFLAASALARSTIDATRGGGARVLDSGHLFDSRSGTLQADDKGAHTMPHTTSSAATLVTLPPRGRD
jgi:hypothetical protein